LNIAVATPNDLACLLQAATGHLEAGEVDAALAAASDACHMAPNAPQAHYSYGQAWLAGNNPARAEEAFATALQLAPKWVDAWIDYGLAKYRQGRIEDAKTAMRQALLDEPGHPAASSNLAAFMRISGETAGAEQLLRTLIAREPGNFGARLNLAADLLQEERAAEALALLEEAEAPTDNIPASRHWLLEKSLALLQLGRWDEGHKALNALTALGALPNALVPLIYWRLLLLALGQGDVPRARLNAERMETWLGAMGPDAVPEHRIMGHYDLAKFWSGLNEHRRAFSHWTQGHVLLKPSQPFLRERHASFIDANIAHFDRARFADGPRAANADPTPIFIVGMPRSGTTLCEQILAAHRNVHGAGERGALVEAFKVLGGSADDPAAVSRIAALDGPNLSAAASSYLAELHALAPDKGRIIDKMPGNYRYLGLAGLMLPGAKIIHCVRDPRDIGLSIFTFRFHGSHPYAHDLADLGWTIAQQERLMDHWRGALPNPILTVKLSDWVESFDKTLERVLTHLGLPSDPNCARFHESESRVRTVSRAQVRQPVNSHGLGRWHRYADDLAPLISELDRAGSLDDWAEIPKAAELAS
jgi:Tfp pilus assembly protein PilF